MSLDRTPHLAAASLVGLFRLALVMFVAMPAGVEPHPPGPRGPHHGAVDALALGNMWLLLARERAGLWLGLLIALAFIPSVGPHKFWTEPAAQALAPLIGVGMLCAVTALVTLGRALKGHP